MTDYKARWDHFYASLPLQLEGRALWDVPPEAAAQRDFDRFSRYFPRDLPLVDFGCGTGTQTAYLKGVWERVTGLDVSGRAIELATRRHQLPGLSFVSIDAGDSGFYQRLHREMGDMNVYIRGVLHQVSHSDLAGLVQSLKTLTGAGGYIYFIEVASTIRDYFRQAPDSFSGLPEAMKRTFISHLPPRGLSLRDIPGIFGPDAFRVLECGEDWLSTNIRFSNRDPIRIPAVYGIVACRQPS